MFLLISQYSDAMFISLHVSMELSPELFYCEYLAASLVANFGSVVDVAYVFASVLTVSLLLLMSTMNKVTQDERERYKLQETAPTHFERGKES